MTTREARRYRAHGTADLPGADVWYFHWVRARVQAPGMGAGTGTGAGAGVGAGYITVLHELLQVNG